MLGNVDKGCWGWGRVSGGRRPRNRAEAFVFPGDAAAPRPAVLAWSYPDWMKMTMEAMVKDKGRYALCCRHSFTDSV